MLKEVWNQHAGTSRTVMRYIPEIVALVERCLGTTQWALRHTGAFTIGAMVSDVADASAATGGIAETNCKAIWPAFDKALALKTFAGKERLLESYPKFVDKGQAFWKGDEQIAAQMKKIALREAKRNNDEYRPHAFSCLWKFAEARTDIDLLPEIVDIVTPHLSEMIEESKMEVDSKEDLETKTGQNGFEAIARGYTRSASRDGGAVVSSVIKALQPYLSSDKFDAIKRQVWYKSVGELMKDVTKTAPAEGTAGFDGHTVFMSYINSLDLDKAETGTHAQRLQRTEAVSTLLKAKRAGVFGHTAGGLDEVEASVEKASKEERATDVQKIWNGILEDVRDAKRAGL